MRVEGLSKIIASVWPASGLSAARAFDFLHGARSGDDRPQVGGRNIDQIEEMSDAAFGHHDAPLPAARCVAACAVRRDRSCRWLRRFRPRSRSAAAAAARRCRRQRPSAASRARSAVTTSPFGTLQRSPISRPSPRTSAMTAGWRSFISASRCFSSSAILRDAIEETRRQHHIEHRIADRHRERIAAEGRAVRADASCPWPASAVPRHAPIGKPPPSALATAMMSGVMPVR